jgi:type VI secretion system secreted protein VgrG
MLTPFRGAIPILTVALALANAGCGSKSEDTPAGPSAITPAARSANKKAPRPQVSVASKGDGVTALAVGPPLGVATTFGLVAASTATNTGVTTLITGDLGVSPGNTDPGFTGANVTGTIHLADGPAGQAQADATTAYGVLAGEACNIDLTGQNLGGKTLTPGVYCFSSSAQLTGTLTLNGLGNAGSVWVFKIASTLTTASGSSVVFINSGQSCGAFWQVGSSATLGTTTNFGGNILALASITLNTGAANSGALFAQTGAVTLDTSNVTAVGSCGSLIQPPPPVPTLPDLAMLALLVLLVGTGAYVLGRR